MSQPYAETTATTTLVIHFSHDRSGADHTGAAGSSTCRAGGKLASWRSGTYWAFSRVWALAVKVLRRRREDAIEP